MEQGAGWAPEPIWIPRKEKYVFPSGFQALIAQSSHYIDYSNPAHRTRQICRGFSLSFHPNALTLPQNSLMIVSFEIFPNWSFKYHRTKVKVKFTLEQVTKAQRGSRGMAVLFL
jgi:hypothetical protein